MSELYKNPYKSFGGPPPTPEEMRELREAFWPIGEDQTLGENANENLSFGTEDPYVSSFLRKAAATYKERNAVYKDNFLMVGRIMMAMFPEGTPRLTTEEDVNRWHLFELAIVKLSRYVQQYEAGGHQDSLEDMIVYLAMVGGRDNAARQAVKAASVGSDDGE